MKALLRLRGKIRPEKKLSAIGYLPSEFSCQPTGLSNQSSALNRRLPIQNLLSPNTYKRIPLILFILVFVSCGAAMAQEHGVQTAPAAKAETINGIVVSAESGEPLEGATVRIKNTNNTTITNAKGEFTLSINNRAGEIEVSFISYLVKEISFSITTNSLVIALDEDYGYLEEVEIHTGYQNIKNERFVGSAVNLDSAAYHRRAGMRILDRLDGTVAGVLFDKKGGGAIPPIQIRGISSLGGGPDGMESLQSPLIVLDNFPYEGDLGAINPNDVESITVLKDAAAASIWGTKAGSGVIVITTKKAKYDQPIRVSIRSNFSVEEKPDLYYYPRMSSAEFIEVEKFLFDKGYFDANLANNTYPYDWPVVSPVVELLQKARTDPAFAIQSNAKINEYSNLDIREDLDRYYFKDRVSQQQYVALNGGSAKHAFNVSLGYNESSSNIRNSDGVSDLTISAANEYRIFEKVRIEGGINYGVHKDNGSGYFLPGQYYPYMELADINGNPLAVPNKYRMSFVEEAGNGQLLDWLYRPLEEIQMADNKNTRKAIRLNFGFSYDFAPWLNAEIKYQYADQKNSMRNHYSIKTWEARDLINRFTNINETNTNLRNPVPIGGLLSLRNGESFSTNLRTQLKINKSWIKHELNALLGAEGSASNQMSTSDRLYGYNDEHATFKSNIDFSTVFPIFTSIYNRSAIPHGSSYREGPLSRLVSFLANVTYAYNDRYVFYASARRDGANVFGVNTNNKWKPLWSAGASWDIKRESFFKIQSISNLRLKASYGFTGNVNNQLSGSPTMAYLSIGSIDINNLPNASLRNPPNPNLRWEKVKTINYGLDFGLFKNRISGNIEFFNKKSTDLISQIPFEPTSGVELYTVNSASLKGNGFEMNINSRNINGPFKWNTNLGLSYSKTIVTEVYNEAFKAGDFINYTLHPSVGKVAYGISSYRWAGLDGQTGDPQGYHNNVVTKNYTAIFADSVNNQVFHGSSIPLYSGFFHNSVKWKNINLSADITYRLKFYYREPSLSYGSVFSWNGLHADYSKRWQVPGDEANTNVPSMVYPIPPEVSRRDEFYYGAEIHVKRADNIRLQGVRLAYDITGNSLSKLFVNNVQLFVYANNLNVILWKAHKHGLDPDYTLSTIETGPTSKIWTFGLSVGL
jgi:TonB-linked SusC/RagA family outer membrane protein